MSLCSTLLKLFLLANVCLSFGHEHEEEACQNPHLQNDHNTLVRNAKENENVIESEVGVNPMEDEIDSDSSTECKQTEEGDFENCEGGNFYLRRDGYFFQEGTIWYLNEEAGYLEMVSDENQTFDRNDDVAWYTVEDGKHVYYHESEVWQGSIFDINHYLQCADSRESNTLKLYDKENWGLFHETYEKIVGREFSSISSNGDFKNGFQVPVEAKFNKYGRGVYAIKEIEKGEVVYASINTALFEDPNHYRQFLKELPLIMACDVLQWAFVRAMSPSKSVVCVDLDEGALLNVADTDEQLNVQLDPQRSLAEKNCNLRFVASRAIKQGGELFLEYSEFVSGYWEDVGLGRTWD